MVALAILAMVVAALARNVEVDLHLDLLVPLLLLVVDHVFGAVTMR